MLRQRRRYLIGTCVLALAAGLTAACGAPGAQSSASGAPQGPQKPSSPITLTILDGAGDQATNGGIIANFAKANPDLVKSVQYESSAASDADSKVQAQEASGHVSIGLVLGGTDILGPLLQNNLLVKLLPAYSGDLPDLSKLQDAARQKMQALAGGYGVMDLYTPSGPMVSYNPLAVTDPPTTPQALLAWAKAHPGKFAYADPANSGSGASFLMSLPYLLGDSDPSDPVHRWTKTWAYLKELGKYISSYPESSSILNKQFGDGTLDMIPTIIAHDISYRQDGTLPPDTQVSLFSNQQWVADAHYMMIPKGVSPQTLYVDLQLMKFILQPSQQVQTYITGIMTPAIAGTTISQASATGQAFVDKWGRPNFYPKALVTGTVDVPLTPSVEQQAFTMWSEQVGSHAG
jgi:putative spermidine/putrescine transport system substrate-binding protein